jgi:hypothetical protein
MGCHDGAFENTEKNEPEKGFQFAFFQDRQRNQAETCAGYKYGGDAR